jgi:hypothetical protein
MRWPGRIEECRGVEAGNQPSFVRQPVAAVVEKEQRYDSSSGTGGAGGEAGNA